MAFWLNPPLVGCYDLSPSAVADSKFVALAARLGKRGLEDLHQKGGDFTKGSMISLCSFTKGSLLPESECDVSGFFFGILWNSNSPIDGRKVP